MAKFDIRELNYITAGKTQNTINISYCYTDDGMIRVLDSSKKPAGLSTLRTNTFFGDIGEHDSMSLNYATNKESFYDLTHNIIIHNLYNINKAKIKTSAKLNVLNATYKDNKELYIPYISSDFIKLCLYKSNAYGLTYELNNNPILLSCNINTSFKYDTIYNYVLSSDNIHTILYPTANEICNGCSSYMDLLSSNTELSNSHISSIFSIKRDLLNISHNYLVEIPENAKHIDYTKGYIIGDSNLAHNHLTYNYNMSVDLDYNLYGCREYCNIDSCGGLLYLTYRTNVKYNNSNASFDNNISTIYMLPDKTPYSYLHVEVIDSWNKFDGEVNSGHKSSMFSIRIFDTGLNESTINDEVKNKLKQNIKNSLRMIIDQMIPAHTLLFDIYFEGK